MAKIKDKTNILMIIQSVARQIFALQTFGQGDKQKVDSRIKILKQSFQKNPSLKRQLKLRRLMQGITVKQQRARQKLIQSVINVAKKLDNSKSKKKLIEDINVDQSYWIKPNKLQQRIGNTINNSRYYGMNFYKQQQQQNRQMLKQKFSGKSSNIHVRKSVQQLCQDFNQKYNWISRQGKDIIKNFFYGNPIQQRKIMNEVTKLKQTLNQSAKQKLQFILQNTNKMDKFDKLFMLTSILDPRSCDSL